MSNAEEGKKIKNRTISIKSDRLLETSQMKEITHSSEYSLLGGWSSNGVKVIYRSLKDGADVTYFKVYDTNESKSFCLKDLNGMVGWDCQFSQDEKSIYFLGGDKESCNFDVLKYDIENKVFTKITDDGYEKDGLICYNLINSKQFCPIGARCGKMYLDFCRQMNDSRP